MNLEIASRTSSDTFGFSEERIYKVDAAGACVSAGYSISLLHRYCSKLLHDEFFYPKPEFYYFDDLGGTVYSIMLPSNAPKYQIVGTPQSSMAAAKKDACLKAIEELHKLGALNEYLLPDQDNVDDELELLCSDSEGCEDESSRGELHEMRVPAVLKEPWTKMENPVNLNSYYIQFFPDPKDRIYKEFGLFIKSPLPGEADNMELDLHLARGRSVKTKLVPSGVTRFNKIEIMQAQHYQEMFFKIILDREEFTSEFVLLGKDDCESCSSTFYLLLPVIFLESEKTVIVDWKVINRCLSSPIFRTPTGSRGTKSFPSDVHLQLDNDYRSTTDIENSLIYVGHKRSFYFVTNVVLEKNGYSSYKGSETSNHMEHLIKTFGIHLKYPGQPLLHAKPLFRLRNLLHSRKRDNTESHDLDEYFDDLPPELCQLKIKGFSKDIGSSVSLLPSIVHHLENLLVAIELKQVLSSSFPEGSEVSAQRILEALTTEKCQERLSLERLEILGDAFLKFAVGRHLFLVHDTLDEGELTRKRSNAVNNSNLLKLATRRNLQVYIRDQPFDPCQFFAVGHRCRNICSEETERKIHLQSKGCAADNAKTSEVRCSKGHHCLHKKTIADVVEALVGAFIVDSGFKAAMAFLRWIGIQVNFEDSLVTNVCLASKSYLSLASSMDMAALEDLLGYRFLHRGLLLQAFVHPSYKKHGGGCYQRLEFLGDAVLDYLITSYLFSVYPKLKPGQLTDLRSVLVNNKALANVAVDRSLHKYLIFDSRGLDEAINNYVDLMKTRSSAKGLFEGIKCQKTLGDLVESCFGAILLDTGFNLEKVWKVMLSFWDPIMSFSSMQLNPIRELQELCQSHDLSLRFPHSKKGATFIVEAKVTGKDEDDGIVASNRSKKDARKMAAELLFAKLKAKGYMPKTKSLEEVLNSSEKAGARLIGYDEIPINVPDDNRFENLKVTEPSGSNLSYNIRSDTEATSTSSPCIISVNKRSSFAFKGVRRQPSETAARPSCDTELRTKGGVQNRSARSRLYEICAANCWKPPDFECCEEEGPSHMKLFIFRVIVKIEAAQDIVLVCSGAPQTKKKAAAEHAADGALWYLEQEGYLH